jgi:hypothetical protein
VYDPAASTTRSEQRLKSAAARCRELGPSFRLTLALLEHSEWLIGQGRAEEGEPLGAAVRETLERLEAKPWREHAAQSQAAAADRGYDLITASEAACRSSANGPQPPFKPRRVKGPCRGRLRGNDSQRGRGGVRACWPGPRTATQSTRRCMARILARHLTHHKRTSWRDRPRTAECLDQA